MIRISRPALIGLAALVALPFLVRFLFASSEKYYLHILIQILIWSFIYTGWSLMGRFGLTSLGHGAFTGIGAYTSVLLWNIARADPLARHPDRRRARPPRSRFSSAIRAFGCASPAIISRF